MMITSSTFFQEGVRKMKVKQSPQMWLQSDHFHLLLDGVIRSKIQFHYLCTELSRKIVLFAIQVKSGYFVHVNVITVASNSHTPICCTLGCNKHCSFSGPLKVL